MKTKWVADCIFRAGMEPRPYRLKRRSGAMTSKAGLRIAADAAGVLAMTAFGRGNGVTAPYVSELFIAAGDTEIPHSSFLIPNFSGPALRRRPA